MAGRRIEIELPQALCDDLMVVAAEIGITDVGEALLVGVADWVVRRKAELDDRDPGQKYFINQALDELLVGKKP